MEIAIGVAIVFVVLVDVFQTIVVPHTVFRVVPLIVRFVLWPCYRWFVHLPGISTYRNSLLEVFAPGAFTVMIFTWLFMLLSGYALIFYGLRAQIHPEITSYAQAFYFSGISIFTIGFGDVVPAGGMARLAVLAGAMSGLIFLALAVSFLFTLQSLLGNREKLVYTLVSRSGTPASGVVILLRYKELGILATLGANYVNWEGWLAGVLESHHTYPLLFYFRSSTPNNSWLSVIGAMLDAASLLATTVRGVNAGEAELFYWLACSTLKSLCEFFGLPAVEDACMTEEQFKQGTELLRVAGYETTDDAFAWKLFSLRRRAYAGYLSTLSQAISVAPPAWIEQLPISRLP